LWERGKTGGHKPQHFPLPCHKLAFLPSVSHKPQSFSLPHATTLKPYLNLVQKKQICGMEWENVVAYGRLPSPAPCGYILTEMMEGGVRIEDFSKTEK